RTAVSAAVPAPAPFQPDRRWRAGCTCESPALDRCARLEPPRYGQQVRATRRHPWRRKPAPQFQTFVQPWPPEERWVSSRWWSESRADPRAGECPEPALEPRVETEVIGCCGKERPISHECNSTKCPAVSWTSPKVLNW